MSCLVSVSLQSFFSSCPHRQFLNLDVGVGGAGAGAGAGAAAAAAAAAAGGAAVAVVMMTVIRFLKSRAGCTEELEP